MRTRILTLCATYLPARRGGTVEAMVGAVARLGAEIDFHIVTRDRYPGDGVPHAGIQPGSWQRVGDATVYYAPPRDLAPDRLTRVIGSARADAYYVNGLLSPTFATQPLMLRWLGLIPHRPLLLAPRGELHPAALRLKRLKKRTFIELARRCPAYTDVLWQASNHAEALQITRVFPGAAISVAPDLVAPRALPASTRPKKLRGSLSVAYLSRITPMKNLIGAIRIVGGLKGRVHFSVYGPVVEPSYMRQCRLEASKLPSNVSISFEGEAPHEEVLRILASHHVFLLPTFGESFGHAIVDAMLAGCISVISDQTPWGELETAGAATVVPLADEAAFSRALQACVDMCQEEFDAASRRAQERGRAVVEDRVAAEQNSSMFQRLRGR